MLSLRDSFGRAPILQQDLTTTGITLVDELDLADTVGSEMPKALAYLALRHDDAHPVEKGQREWPDGAL